MSGTWEEHSRRKINRRIENSARKNFNKKRLPGDFGSRFWERCRMCHAPH
nr:MAG TPA: cytochrome c-552 [Caudoviricetes sp.]